jgi:predicted nucleic acid-binding protein
MKDKILIDTNLWIYLYASNPEGKRRTIEEVIQQNFEKVILSPQILGELYHVVTRKGFQTQKSAKHIVLEMVATFPVSEIGSADVLEAIRVHEMFNYSYWDSLLIATALLNDCESLYSEDMQHKQSIEGKIRIINPFA